MPVVHIMVDAHVHIHEHFDLDRLFLNSLQNFRKSLDGLQIHDGLAFYLLLTESANVNCFQRLKALAGVQLGGREHSFTVAATGEDHTLKISTEGRQCLYVVSGKQIVTAENLEILALGYRDDYPDGRPLTYVIEDLAASGCLRVLPWGVGKWLGARGNLINSIVSSWEGGHIFLGDNGNRPSFWKLPEIFETAAEKEIVNLPGSDPLPFVESEKKAGSYGFMLHGYVDHEKPFSSLSSQVMSTPQAVCPFGTPESITPFIKNQIRMQLVKRFR